MKSKLGTQSQWATYAVMGSLLLFNANAWGDWKSDWEKIGKIVGQKLEKTREVVGNKVEEAKYKVGTIFEENGKKIEDKDADFVAGKNLKNKIEAAAKKTENKGELEAVESESPNAIELYRGLKENPPKNIEKDSPEWIQWVKNKYKEHITVYWEKDGEDAEVAFSGKFSDRTKENLKTLDDVVDLKKDLNNGEALEPAAILQAANIDKKNDDLQALASVINDTELGSEKDVAIYLKSGGAAVVMEEAPANLPWTQKIANKIKRVIGISKKDLSACNTK